MSANPSNLETSLRPGDKLDKFEVVEQIGAGGMSIVWKGYDRLLDRHVAIKQLSPELAEAQESFRDRFRAEAHLQRRLSDDSEHLVRIIDFLDDQRGLFIVMEYVDGQSLEQLLASRSGPLEQRQALGIVGATAVALRTIHERSVIHRDLKPSNILLPREGGLKVCDFGIAALVEDQEALSLGSVRYMAPELFSDEQTADARADIYALGMIAYEMLAGREKFNEAFRIVLRDQRNQALRWMKWHTNSRAKAPPLSSLNGEVPGALEELVARMMEKEPAARIRSADEVLDAIRRHFAGGEAAPAATASAPAAAPAAAALAAHEPTAALPKRSRLPIILAALLLVQVLAVAIWWGLGQAKASRAHEAERTAALQQFEEARGHLEAERYEEAALAFGQLARHWPDDPVLGKGSVDRQLWAQANLDYRQDQLERAARTVDQLQDRDIGWQTQAANLEKQIQKRQAFLKEVRLIDELIDAGRYDEAQLRLRQQRQVEHTLTELEREQFNEQARRLAGQIERAKVQEALDQAQKLADEGQLERAHALLMEAQQKLSAAGELKEASQRLSQELAYRGELTQADRAQRDDLLPEAIAALQRAQAIRSDPQVQVRLNQLRAEHAYREGQRLEAEGRPEEAAVALTRALGYDDGHQQAREALARLKVADQRDAFFRAGDAAFAEGDFDRAIKQYQLGLELADDAAIRGKMRQATIESRVSQGRTALSQGDVDQARRLFNEVLQLDPEATAAREGLQSVARWQEYERYRDEGDAYRRQSRYSEAIRRYSRAREVIDTQEVRQRLEDVEFESIIASAKAEIAAKNWSAARAWLRTALKMRDSEEVRSLLEFVRDNDPDYRRPPEGDPEGEEEGSS